MSEIRGPDQLEAAIRFSVRKIEQKFGGMGAISVEIADVAGLTAQIEEIKTSIREAVAVLQELENQNTDGSQTELILDLGQQLYNLRLSTVHFFLSALESEVQLGSTPPEFGDAIAVVRDHLLLDKTFMNSADRAQFAGRVQALNGVLRPEAPQPVVQAKESKVPAEVALAIDDFNSALNTLDAAANDATFSPQTAYLAAPNAYAFLVNQQQTLDAEIEDWMENFASNSNHELEETRAHKKVEAFAARRIALNEKLLKKDPKYIALRTRADQLIVDVAGGTIHIDGTQDVSAFIGELNILVIDAQTIAAINADAKSVLVNLTKDVALLIDKLQYAQWLRDLETTHAELRTLAARIGSVVIPFIGNPTATRDGLRTELAAARAATQAVGYDQQRTNHLDTTYFKPGDNLLAKLDKAVVVYEQEQAIAAFDANVAPLRGAIAAVPPSRGALNKVQIEALSATLETTHHAAEIAGHLSKKPDMIPPISSAIDDILRQLIEARSRLKKFLEEAIKPKEVADLTIEELARELLDSDIPIENRGDALKFMGRERLLAQAYYERIGSVDHRDPTKLGILQWKARIVMNRFDDAVTYEEAASGDVTSLEKRGDKAQGGLLTLVMPREQIMAATTENPKYGWQIKFILRHIIETAALRYKGPGQAEKLVRRNAKKVVVPDGVNLQADDMIIGKLPNGDRQVLRGGQEVVLAANEAPLAVAPTAGRYKDHVVRRGMEGRSYVDLSGQGGRKYLLDVMINEAIATLPPGMEIDPDDYDFIKNICHNEFVVFDMLSISLAQAQQRTQTRAHNNELTDINRIAFLNPLADSVHSTFRYDNPHYFGNWILFLYPELPENGFFGKGGKAEKTNELRDLEILFLETFFDTSQLTGKLPLPGFCEGLFPSTYDMITLNPSKKGANGSESVQYGNDFFDKQGNPVGKQDQASFVNYYTAQAGWKTFIEKVYQELAMVSYDQIAEQSKAGAKGGFFQEIISVDLGKAKMFDGPHMHEAMPLLLTFLIYRIFSSYKGTSPDARKDLFDNVVKTLLESRNGGGLQDYKDEINQVLRSISKPGSGAGDKWEMGEYLLPQGYGYRFKERVRYLEAMWEEEHPGKTFPVTLNITQSKILSFSPSPEALEIVEMLNKEKQLKAPFNRGGQMIQVKEEK